MDNGREKVGIKAILLLAMTVFIRAFPRPPNVEPVMAGMLPVARKHGAAAAALFAFASMLVADALMARVGWWSIYTAIAYALVAFFSFDFVKAGGLKNYALTAVAGTLAFDAITMALFAVQFDIPLPLAAAAQVPFTLMHLVGNTVLVVAATPLIEKYVLETPAAAKAVA